MYFCVHVLDSPNSFYQYHHSFIVGGEAYARNSPRTDFGYYGTYVKGYFSSWLVKLFTFLFPPTVMLCLLIIPLTNIRLIHGLVFYYCVLSYM